MNKRYLTSPVASKSDEKRPRKSPNHLNEDHVALSRLSDQPNIPPTPIPAFAELVQEKHVHKAAVIVYPLMLGLNDEIGLTSYVNTLTENVKKFLDEDYHKMGHGQYPEDCWARDRKFLQQMMITYFPTAFLGLRYTEATPGDSSPYFCPLCHKTYTSHSIMSFANKVDAEYHPSRKATAPHISEWFNNKGHHPPPYRTDDLRSRNSDGRRRSWVHNYGTFDQMITHCQNVEYAEPSDKGHYLMRMYLHSLSGQVFDKSWLLRAYRERAYFSGPDKPLADVVFDGPPKNLILAINKGSNTHDSTHDNDNNEEETADTKLNDRLAELAQFAQDKYSKEDIEKLNKKLQQFDDTVSDDGGDMDT